MNKLSQCTQSQLVPFIDICRSPEINYLTKPLEQSILIYFFNNAGEGAGIAKIKKVSEKMLADQDSDCFRAARGAEGAALGQIVVIS